MFLRCNLGSLVDDEIFPGSPEVTSTHIARVARVGRRGRIDVSLHFGLEMRVQEIPGVRALRDISTRSILHFLRLTFLTPTLMRHPPRQIHTSWLVERDVFLRRKTRSAKQSITRAGDVLEIVGKEVDKLIAFKWFTCVIEKIIHQVFTRININEININRDYRWKNKISNVCLYASCHQGNVVYFSLLV